MLDFVHGFTKTKLLWWPYRCCMCTLLEWTINIGLWMSMVCEWKCISAGDYQLFTAIYATLSFYMLHPVWKSNICSIDLSIPKVKNDQTIELQWPMISLFYPLVNNTDPSCWTIPSLSSFHINAVALQIQKVWCPCLRWLTKLPAQSDQKLARRIIYWYLQKPVTSMKLLLPCSRDLSDLDLDF